MVLEDPALLEVVYGKLKQHVGRPLTEIGDLEIQSLAPEAEAPPQASALPPLALQVGGQNKKVNRARADRAPIKNALLQLLQQPGHILRQVGDGLEALGVIAAASPGLRP